MAVHISENHTEVAGYYDDILQVRKDPEYIIKSYVNTFIGMND